jgi:ABC-type ATPase involved in cell division
MRLSAFRIRNFRSIIDTDWQPLSPDNITCLIGQNESGKTSILEGLRAFYTGTISEDILRSDLSFPETSCRFVFEPGWLLTITDNPGTELKELLSTLDHLELTRVWLEDFTSVVRVGGEISQYLDSLEDAWRLYLEDVSTKLEEEIKDIEELGENLKVVSAQKTSLEEKVALEKKTSGRFRIFRKKSADLQSETASHKVDNKKLLSDINRQLDEIRKELQGKKAIRKVSITYFDLKDKVSLLEKDLDDLTRKLEEHHQKLTLLMRPLKDYNDAEWERVLESYHSTRETYEDMKLELTSHIAFCAYIMEGKPEEEARKLVSEIIQTYRSQLTNEILGKKYFEYCPVIGLFEDFGSLLPNRIDMEDIINGNESVEGYKAARNFLTIARLDYSFFQQPSSRILKQKIEDLNQVLTVNFQDFWQQSIGKNNKIRIQFELDHYNASFGDKAGKPYLEFWIKDEEERLYPKQRSRGVRWFLSFYMELQASAVSNTKPMVLLVDEPGVSLHARAQEDVLKVFEDIKDRIQVIYTTHSPHLVDINKLHRVLAVQRDEMDNMRSNTRILDPLQLSDATPDTLTPLQSIMGNPITSEGFSSERLNLIVNDIGTFYMLSAVLQVSGYKGKISLVPSTEVSSIPLMCNIMMGWGLRFAVVLFNNDEERQMEEFLSQKMFRTEKNDGEMIITMNESILNAEDLLSTLDFKNHVLNTREGITVPNSIYMKDKDLPRDFLLSKFLSEIKTGNITARDFDEESLENFRQFIQKVGEVK